MSTKIEDLDDFEDQYENENENYEEDDQYQNQYANFYGTEELQEQELDEIPKESLVINAVKLIYKKIKEPMVVSILAYIVINPNFKKILEILPLFIIDNSYISVNIIISIIIGILFVLIKDLI